MNKSLTGTIANLAGQSAEMQVAADYERRGHHLAARRWRGKAGEVDLIFNSGSEVVFVEVKKARHFSDAALRISSRQQQRICLAAEEYLGTQPNGLLTPMRVDAAFVNGHGEVQVLENAIGHF
ncbi:YraN family protein [Planktotalea arctica]|uniref:YraN family protein n=1 Tax=Planktotalea arctica TaxID=1481893 RepID=UPI000A174F9F|nr:YraN family protein [Planktotalea arctica]